MQISALLNISPHFSIGEIDMPLPSDKEAWESRLARGHLDHAQSRSDTLNFRHVLENLLSVGKLPQPLNPFGLSIIAHTLFRWVSPRFVRSGLALIMHFRLCTDASALDPIIPYRFSGDGSFYRLSFPANFKQ